MIIVSSSSFGASNNWETPEENEAQWQLLRRSKIEQLEKDAAERTRKMEEEKRLLREYYETRQWQHDNPEADMKRRLDAD